MIIWLDYSTFKQVKGVITRFIKEHGKKRKEIPGCKERLNWEFFKYVLYYNKRKRHFIVNTIKNIDKDKIIIFRKQKNLNKWLEEQNINIKKRLD